MIPPFVFSLLGSRLFWLAIAFAAVAGWGGIQTWRLDTAQKELVAAQQQIASLEQQRDMAVAAGQKCSESVKTLKSESEKRTRIAASALAKARKGNVSLLDQIKRRDAILAANQGKPAGDCDAGKALSEIRREK